MKEDKSIKIKDILNFLEEEKMEYKFHGNREVEIKGFSSLTNYKEGSLTWVRSGKYLEAAGERLYSCLITSHEEIFETMNCSIRVENPKRVFFMVLKEFFYEARKPYFNRTACYISPEVKLGENVVIGPGAVLDGNITIGDNTVIQSNVIINDKVKIGKNCTIQVGVCIGNEGLGYVDDEEGNHIRIENYGGVTIGNDVNIGPYCFIERGVIDDTCIGDNCQIDGLCSISHNSVLGRGVSLIVGAQVYGSCNIGENSYIVSSLVRDGVHIGKNVVVGMGSVVTKNVEDGQVVIGVPAVVKNKSK